MLLVALAFFAGDFDQCNCDLHPDAANCQASGGGSGAPVACTGDGGYTGCISSPNPVGAPPAAPPPPPTAPAATTSRYMSTVAPAALFAEGVAAAQAGETGVIVLDFGQPQQRGSTFGALLLDNSTFASVSDIEIAVEQFLYGYYLYSTPQMNLVVAIGTNNFVGATGTVNAAHGVAWANLATGVEDYVLDQGWYGLSAAAADDIEPDWSSVTDAEDWVTGFDSTATTRLYEDGSAEGCPPDSPIGTVAFNANCNNRWTQLDVRFVSWGAAHSYPLPEIYATNGVHARVWQKISLESALTGGHAMLFQGSFTQHAACPADPRCTVDVDNTASTGWSQLLSTLNSDSRTTVTTLPWSTDVTWAN
jgi:hypothetical protein